MVILSVLIRFVARWNKVLPVSSLNELHDLKSSLNKHVCAFKPWNSVMRTGVLFLALLWFIEKAIAEATSKDHFKMNCILQKSDCFNDAVFCKCLFYRFFFYGTTRALTRLIAIAKDLEQTNRVDKHEYLHRASNTTR